jgi:hypothetical protein
LTKDQNGYIPKYIGIWRERGDMETVEEYIRNISKRRKV